MKMAQHTIVLAHGILGFGSLPGMPSLLNYFNGVAAHLGQQGHTVIAPQVNPIGSIAQRGGQLAAAILAIPPAQDPLHIIAHSMGGMDARYAVRNVPGVAERVKTLVTIGTPHRGSAVADAVVAHTGPLFVQIPKPVVALLESNAGGLRDLTTTIAIQFDESTPNDEAVRYIEVAGDASKGGHTLLLFKLAELIGQLKGEVNDGVVTKSSALRERTEHLDDWPVDHAGLIGWSLDPTSLFGFRLPLFAPPEHLARYDAIVQML
jgi:triacylglycerol lipase